jgi:parallel beta-helix repeat protein
MAVTRFGSRRTMAGAVVALCLAAAAITATPADAAPSVLHVDKRAGRCSDSGPGTGSRPFCSIGAAAAVARPGQTVSVSAGRYFERVVPERSGLPGRRIVYTAAGPRVSVLGQANGFYLTRRSWVTLRGFTIRNTTGPGIKVSSASHVVVRGNDVSFAGQRAPGLTAKGIVLRGVRDGVVARNRVHHNSNSGIGVGASSSNVRVKHNESFANARGFARAAAGIDVRTSTGVVVSGNVCRGNEDSGINIWTGSHGATATNNVVHHNGDHGVDVLQSNDANVVANTVHGNVDSGIEVTGSLRTRIINNISTDNGVNSPRTSGNIRTDEASAPSTVLDYNLLSSPGELIDWAGRSHTSLAEFQAATGQEAHGIQAEPGFRDVAAGDLRLTARSPAIDSADSGATGQPLTDADGRARVDVAAVANRGAGPRGYDDRGAYEFQP